MDDECLCGNINLNGAPVSKNWNPECPVHPWSEHLQAQADRAREIQAEASAARRKHRYEILERSLLEAAADCDERGHPRNVSERFRSAAAVCGTAGEPPR